MSKSKYEDDYKRRILVSISSLLVAIFLNILLLNSLRAQEASSIVYHDADGCLRYKADTEGNYIPDFSYAGYKNGEVPLPKLAVVKEMGPIEGDNTLHIQSALDGMDILPLNEEGFRGALLLAPGRYEIHGIITIRVEGVVLRGSGAGADPDSNTIFLGIGNTPADRDIIRVGNLDGVGWGRATNVPRSTITSNFIPAGSRSIEVAEPQNFSVGQNVIIYQPSTEEWLASINFGDTDSDDPWTPGQIDLYFNRYISAINMDESKIVVDVPIYDHLNRSLAIAEVYVLEEPDIRRNIGIENLRIDIQTASTTDEAHAKNAIRLIGVEDCWVSQVTALHFVYAAVDTRTASRVTIQNCQGLEPHSLIDGARRYNFAVGTRSNNILFENCHTSEGRHSYVSNGTSSVSGIVFYNCTSEGDHASSEGHRRWSQGLLYDNVKFSHSSATNLLGLYNRGSYGTGHGWASVHSVAWHVQIALGRRMILQKPPGRQNYAIACESIVTNSHQFRHPLGFVELTKQDPIILSLYAAQLESRLTNGVPPDAPARLIADRTEEGVRLQWLDIASNETGYHLDYSLGPNGPFIDLVNLEADATSFLHEDAPVHNDELIYRVCASGTGCPSAYANPASLEVVTNTQNHSIPGLLVFPNPVSDLILIEAENSISEISIYDLRGKLMLQRIGAGKIESQTLANGIYLVEIRDGRGGMSVTKVVKR